MSHLPGLRPITGIPPVRAGRVIAWTVGAWCVLTVGIAVLTVTVAAAATDNSGGFGEIFGTMLLVAMVAGAVLLVPAIAVAAVVIGVRAARTRIIAHRMTDA